MSVGGDSVPAHNEYRPSDLDPSAPAIRNFSSLLLILCHICHHPSLLCSHRRLRALLQAVVTTAAADCSPPCAAVNYLLSHLAVRVPVDAASSVFVTAHQTPRINAAVGRRSHQCQGRERRRFLPVAARVSHVRRQAASSILMGA
jgi:hypothetical protein